MSAPLCSECGEYPAGSRCSAFTCPGRFGAVPFLEDGEGFPFRLIGRLPYRPADFDDWREGNLLFSHNHFFALAQSGAPVPHHIGEVPIGDALPAKS